MKTNFALILIFVLSLFACESKNTQRKKETKPISIEMLTTVLDSIDNKAFLQSHMKGHSFMKKGNGVFVSFEHIQYKKPKHYVNFSNIKGITFVSLSTADKNLWLRVIEEFKNAYNPDTIKRHTIEEEVNIKYKSNFYTFETYEPTKGVNVIKNNFYQIYVKPITN